MDKIIMTAIVIILFFSVYIVGVSVIRSFDLVPAESPLMSCATYGREIKSSAFDADTGKLIIMCKTGSDK